MPLPRTINVTVVAMICLLCSAPLADGEVRLIGVASIPGDAKDLSGLREKLADGTPQDRLGSMGSAIAYTGAGHRFVMLDDRGPADGAVGFACRLHQFDIDVDPAAKPAVRATLVAT